MLADIVSDRLRGSSHEFSTKPGQNPLKFSDNVTESMLLTFENGVPLIR